MPMFYANRPTVFVLAHTDNGTMITSYMDWEKAGNDGVIGVTVELFNKSSYEPTEIEFLCHLLDLRRAHYGDGAVMIDGGANNGCYTVPVALHMIGWGDVIAFEPQRVLSMVLGGNIVINNVFDNAKSYNMALGAKSGEIGVPAIDYAKPRNLGGVEMTREPGAWQVPMLAIDSLQLPRVDLIKLDIEGMEIEALAGMTETLERCKPVLCVEHIKVGEEALRTVLIPKGYDVQPFGMNLICINRKDKVSDNLQFVDKSQAA